MFRIKSWSEDKKKNINSILLDVKAGQWNIAVCYRFMPRSPFPSDSVQSIMTDFEKIALANFCLICVLMKDLIISKPIQVAHLVKKDVFNNARV